MQTPQGFRVELLRQAHQRALERLCGNRRRGPLVRGLPVFLVPGGPENIKRPRLGSVWRADSETGRPGGGVMMRVGQGLTFCPGGGPPASSAAWRFPTRRAVWAQRTRTWLPNALMDALLGEAALGHWALFPDTQEAYGGPGPGAAAGGDGRLGTGLRPVNVM